MRSKTLAVALCGFLAAGLALAGDPLPSWHVGPTREAILSFVAKVTDEDGPAFVPPADRIATFDNDGTLWTEKPLYTHFYGVLAQLKTRVSIGGGLRYWLEGPDGGPEGLGARALLTFLFPK